MGYFLPLEFGFQEIAAGKTKIDNSSIIGPNLPINLSSHKMVTTPDGKQVIVVGGETGTGKMTNLMIKYSGLGGSWTIMNEKINILSDARKDFVAFVVPNDLTYCEYCKADCLP